MTTIDRLRNHAAARIRLGKPPGMALALLESLEISAAKRDTKSMVHTLQSARGFLMLAERS